jgi:hypothetical protein
MSVNSEIIYWREITELAVRMPQISSAVPKRSAHLPTGAVTATAGHYAVHLAAAHPHSPLLRGSGQLEKPVSRCSKVLSFHGRQQ